jgi:phage tail tape-measure protein
MQRYFAIAIVTLIAAGAGMVSQFYLPNAHAAGAYGKGAGFAKQTFKENRKKPTQKMIKGNATRPLGP